MPLCWTSAGMGPASSSSTCLDKCGSHTCFKYWHFETLKAHSQSHWPSFPCSHYIFVSSSLSKFHLDPHLSTPVPLFPPYKPFPLSPKPFSPLFPKPPSPHNLSLSPFRAPISSLTMQMTTLEQVCSNLYYDCYDRYEYTSLIEKLILS